MILEIVLKFFWPLPISNTILKNIVYWKKKNQIQTMKRFCHLDNRNTLVNLHIYTSPVIYTTFCILFQVSVWPLMKEIWIQFWYVKCNPHTYILYGMLMHWNSFRGIGDTTGSAKTKGNRYLCTRLICIERYINCLWLRKY